MKTGLVLHSVENAKDMLVKQSAETYDVLLTTHAGVETFLKYEHDLECECLSRYLTTVELIETKRKFSHRVGALLRQLDARAGEREIIPLPFRDLSVFNALYGYVGRIAYLDCLTFIMALKYAIGRHGLEKIEVYKCQDDYFSRNSLPLLHILSTSSQRCRFEEINITDKNSRNTPTNQTSYHKLVQSLIAGCNKQEFKDRVLSMVAKPFFRFNRKQAKRVLVFEKLYDLKFLAPDLLKYDVLWYEANGALLKGANGNLRRSDRFKGVNTEGLISHMNAFDSAIVGFILKAFESYFCSYFNSLTVLDQHHREKPIDLAIWGNSPDRGFKALVFEYCKVRRIPIIGMQHGTGFCEQHDTWREYTDISRCNYFISYGFTQDDMKRILPRSILDETAKEVVVCPLGTTKTMNRPRRVKSKRVIDVLFPVTYVKTMLLGGGCARIPPHVLSDRAVALLKFLDGLEASILIKPMINTNYENSVFLPILKRLKNKRILTRSDLPLIHYMEQYHVRSVMLEYASTTLYECLPYDTEIFAMFDTVRSFTQTAMALLKKRVHVCEDIETMTDSIGRFMAGDGEVLRDEGFLFRYCKKPDTKRNIRRLVHKILNAKSS